MFAYDVPSDSSRRHRAHSLVFRPRRDADARCVRQSAARDKSTYVGDWHANGFFLSITQDGHVHYKRVGAVNKTINAPLKRFESDNLVVGVGPVTTTFVVSSVPHAEGDKWKVTVDGVELRKLP